MPSNCGAGEGSWEFLRQQGDQTNQSERKSTLNTYWKNWCWSWSSNTLTTWCEELTYCKRHWCWERLKAEGEEGDRGWEGWMASLIQWTWTWATSRRWWGRPGMLQSTGSQRVGLCAFTDWVWFLVGELRVYKMHGIAKKKKKEKAIIEEKWHCYCRGRNIIVLLQEEGPFQGPKLGSYLTLGNELSEETPVLTSKRFYGKGHLGGESRRVREPKRTALPCGLQLRFYGDGIRFQVVFSQSFWLRVLPGGARLVQPRWMPERRILGGGRTCDVSFDLSFWWWLIISVFLTRTSCHKTTHANGYYGAWPGWAVLVSVLPLMVL